MDVYGTREVGGRLQVSTEAIGKIAKLAALEIEGVSAVTIGDTGVKGVFSKANITAPVDVEIAYDVATITVCISAAPDAKIPVLCEEVQENVKTTVQNMAGIAVSKVNIVVTGVSQKQTVPEK